MRVLILAALMLGACAKPGTVIKTQVETVSVPVIQKCASDRPDAVPALRDRIDAAAWQAMSLKQKAEMTAAQSLRRHNYSLALDAATSAC